MAIFHLVESKIPLFLLILFVYCLNNLVCRWIILFFNQLFIFVFSWCTYPTVCPHLVPFFSCCWLIILGWQFFFWFWRWSVVTYLISCRLICVVVLLGLLLLFFVRDCSTQCCGSVTAHKCPHRELLVEFATFAPVLPLVVVVSLW